MLIKDTSYKKETTEVHQLLEKGLWEIEELDKEQLLQWSKTHSDSLGALQPSPVVIKKKKKQEVIRHLQSLQVLISVLPSFCLQKASIKLDDVVVHFDILCAGSSSSVISLTAMVEAAAKSWSSEVSLQLTYIYIERERASMPG